VIFAPYTVVVKTLLLPGLTALLLATLTVVPAAVHILDWQGAGAAYDSAASEARGASSELADAEAELEAARDAATLALADATAVASAGSGYLAAGAVAELTSANAELQEALDADEVEGAGMPSAERPETIAALKERAAALAEWATGEATRADAVADSAVGLGSLAVAARDAAVAAAGSVSSEAANALAVAPIASADSKAAFESARDALIAAAQGDEPIAHSVTGYASAMEAMFASQHAEADAQAAADAAGGEGGESDEDRAAARQKLLQGMLDHFGQDIDDCVPIPDGWLCP